MKASIGFTLLIVALFIAGCLQGCGSRKVQTTINKQSEERKEEIKESGSEESKTEVKKENKEESKADKKEIIITTTTVDEINDKGRVNKRTTTTKKEVRSDKSTNNKSGSEASKSENKKNWLREIERKEVIRIYLKDKASVVSNIPFYVVIGVLGAIALFFVYMYLRVRKKSTPSMF